MRLKSIKLAGFKSFVDPTMVPFPNKITAIVGPNGCGKSNIIDAVRWVMGESSAKSLRGENMTDVIFNGSSARKPVSLASIELVFDNSDAKIVGEYARYNEISVKRQVNRESQSSYFLNGTRCRRKDITDLFLGTGLGARSYSIIEQGMIARLIEAKPIEMRLFIEEAAGISKYKDRRRETENRIRRTRDNLERLTDLREELDRQLERLSRQAKAAEKYKELKAEERQKTAELLALRWRELDQRAAKSDAAMRDLDIAAEAGLADLRHTEARIEAVRDVQLQVQDKFNQAQQTFYALGAEVARLEQSITHRRERHKELHDALQQAAYSLSAAKQTAEEDQQKKAEIEAKLDTLSPNLMVLREQEFTAAEALEQAEQVMRTWQDQWDEFSQRSGDAQRKADVAQSQSRHLESSIERLADRLNRLKTEQAGLTTDPLAQEMASLEASLDASRAQQEEAEASEQQCLQALTEQRNANSQLHREQETLRDSLQQQHSRRMSLEALQQAAMGDDGALSQWLERHALDKSTRLADQLDVEPGWEKAVEMVLGDTLHGLCIQGFEQVGAWLDDLEHGSLSLFDGSLSLLDGSQSATSEGRLSRLVKGEVVPAVLDSVYSMEHFAEALIKRSSLLPGESVITRDGVWMGRDWLRVTRQQGQQGLLERRHELETLTEAIATNEATLDELKARLTDGRERAAELEQEREDRQQQVKRIAREVAEWNAQKSAREVQYEQVKMRRQRLEQELQEVQSQYDLEQAQLAETRLGLSQALDAMEHDVVEREELHARREQLRVQLDDQRSQARELKDRCHHLAMEERALRTQCDALAQGLVRQAAQRDALHERKALLEEQLAAVADPDELLGDSLEDKLAERLEAETVMQQVRRELEEQEFSMRELNGQRAQQEQVLQRARDRLNEKKLADQEIKVRSQTLKEQLQAENYDLPTLLQLLPEDAAEKDWQDALADLAQRISRLGQINLAAIDEYEQESERKTYLDQQNADLEDALNTLENAIRKIDRETRSRFKEYFDHINKGFQELFPKVFGGGHAYLELTEDDLLEAGVAIMARPPGKQNSTIHLLSGGEKSMVALSLIFSIFRLNPAPFCILDEVDAPLDDANVGRFTNLVREMSPLVQFIYITHNKVAMEMADTLMGVTMHEPGVSRIVAVDVEQAAELAGG